MRRHGDQDIQRDDPQILGFSVAQACLLLVSITAGTTAFVWTAATLSSLAKNLKITWLAWPAEDIVAFLTLIVFLCISIAIVRKQASKSDKQSEPDRREFFLDSFTSFLVLCSPLVFSISVLYVASKLNGITIPLLPFSLASLTIAIGKLVLVVALLITLSILKFHSNAKFKNLSIAFLIGWLFNAAQHFLISIR